METAAACEEDVLSEVQASDVEALSITECPEMPLGIRTDKGEGGSFVSAAESGREMDDTLRELHEWKSTHEASLATLKLKYEKELEGIYNQTRQGQGDDEGGEEANNGGGMEANEDEQMLRIMLRRLSMAERGGEEAVGEKLEVQSALSKEQLTLLTSSGARSFGVTDGRQARGVDDQNLSTFDEGIADDDNADLDNLEDTLVEWNGEMDAIFAKMDALKPQKETRV